jgi:hypothetical protein
MAVDRRSFIRSVLALATTSVLDVDKLLWVPGQKTIFIPTQRQVEVISSRVMRIPLAVNYSAIIELEMRKVASKIPSLFEHDELLFQRLSNRKVYAASPRPSKE